MNIKLCSLLLTTIGTIYGSGLESVKIDTIYGSGLERFRIGTIYESGLDSVKDEEAFQDATPRLYLECYEEIEIFKHQLNQQGADKKVIIEDIFAYIDSWGHSVGAHLALLNLVLEHDSASKSRALDSAWNSGNIDKSTEYMEFIFEHDPDSKPKILSTLWEWSECEKFTNRISPYLKLILKHDPTELPRVMKMLHEKSIEFDDEIIGRHGIAHSFLHLIEEMSREYEKSNMPAETLGISGTIRVALTLKGSVVSIKSLSNI